MRPITPRRPETALRTDDVARSAPRRLCWLSRSISGRDGGGDVKNGTVGIKAYALSSSASTARGAAGGRSISSDALTLDVLETLGTQLSCHPAVGSGPQDLGILPWSPICGGWLHFYRDPRIFTHTLPRCVPIHTPGPSHRHALMVDLSSTP